MKFAIITGASSGLGRETCRQLARQRAVDELWLVARRESELNKLSEEVDLPCKILPLDLSRPEDAKRLIKTAHQAIHGGDDLHWLVLAAGFGKLGRLDEERLTAAQGMIDLNISALTNLAGALLPHMHLAHCLLYASVAAFLPQPGFAVYAASKSYVLSLSRALAIEYPEVKVCAVCPNPVETEFFNNIGGSPSGIKQIGLEKAEKVVAKSIRNCRRGKHVSTSCLSAKLIKLICKLLPHSFMLWCCKKLGVYQL